MFKELHSVSDIVTAKREALGFLKNHRTKRDLREECDEGCSLEELKEVYEPNNERSVSIK